MIRGLFILFLCINVISCSSSKDKGRDLGHDDTTFLKGSDEVSLRDVRVTDDGSWVYIIDDEVITKEQFEEEYALFLNIMGTSSGVSKEAVELKSELASLKEDILERLINNRLTYKEAIASPFFQSEDGKNLIKSFFKTALNQYHIYKSVLPKIKNPTAKEIKDFYTEYKSVLFARGIKDTKLKRSQSMLTKFYKDMKMQSIMAKEIAKVRLENRIRENSKVLEDYLAGKITKDDIDKPLNSSKYWVLKINEDNISLKEIIGIIDFQLKALKTEGKSKKSSQSQISDYIISTIKTMELSYLIALDKGYHLTAEGKQFIKLVQIRSISLYYLMNKVISKVKMPSYKEARKVLKDRNKNKKFKDLIKNSKMKYSKRDIEDLIRQMIYKEHVLLAQNKFLSKLKDEHKIRISEKYFETKADIIQKEILMNK